VIRPVPVSRQLPGWFPNNVERQLTFAGVIELVVSEEGKVLSATIEKSVNTRYDALLLDAAKSWTFKPATRDGAPVKFRYQMAVNLTPKL
jgi:TonB family protein